MLRIFRGTEADFGTVDLPVDAGLAHRVYTDDTLGSMADAGFNAVWVRVIFRELLPNRRYPGFGVQSEELLRSLNAVGERGYRHGVQLIAYCQEPLGMRRDDPFWEEHPGLAGVAWDYNFGSDEDPYLMRAFCTSSDEAREYLSNSSSSLLRLVPGIGGVITITASEFMSHCYSHRRGLDGDGAEQATLCCPRCARRPAVEVVAEILNCMRAGMSQIDQEVPLIAWNWSWGMYEEDPQPGILSRLAPGIDIMAGFERGGVKTDATGTRVEIDEYSLCYAGPSARFRTTREAAVATGRRIYAKLQISTTHELASVSNLPLIPTLFHKARAMRELDVAGSMGCWNFGNQVSLNTRALAFFLADECPDAQDAAVEALARRELPGSDSQAICTAWRLFVRAYDHYPFSIPFLYHSPMNYSLALPLTLRPLRDRPIGRSWHMDPRDDRDDPTRCFGPFSAEEIHERLDTMAQIWGAGLREYEGALPDSHPELDAARAVWLSIRSTRNYFALYLLKRSWHTRMPTAAVPSVRRIIEEELATLDQAITVYSRDTRQGYHGEAHEHMVTPELIRTKRRALEATLAEL